MLSRIEEIAIASLASGARTDPDHGGERSRSAALVRWVAGVQLILGSARWADQDTAVTEEDEEFDRAGVGNSSAVSAAAMAGVQQHMVVRPGPG
jgi:hypothetical protein